MKQLMVVAVFYFSVIHISFANSGPGKNIVPSTLKSAIVYRSGAELFHSAKVTLAQGNNEFIIDGISNKIEVNSVRITADNNQLTIMSVEFGQNFLRAAEESAGVKKIRDSIQHNSDELALVQANINTAKELQLVLAANKSIAGSQNGVSVQELTKMMDYYRSKATELQKELFTLKDKENKLRITETRLLEQLKEEEQKNVSTSGQLSFQAFSPMAGTYTLTVSYITPLAAWNPSYDLRVENITKPVNIGFKAKLTQTSGIDWKNVKLVLATSMPNMNATAPELKSWLLAFPQLNAMRDVLAGKTSGIMIRGVSSLQEVVVTGYGRKSDSDDFRQTPEPVYILDGNMITREQYNQINKQAIKSVNVLKEDKASAIYGSRAAGGAIVIDLKKGMEDYVNENDNQLNVTYEIDLPYDVPTNGKEQVVSLKEKLAPATYKYFAAPVKDKDAYLLGCIGGWESLQLLPGEANIIFEGTYVGKTFINPGSTSDTLNLTLGKDRRVVITREKLKDFSSVKFLNTKKLHTFTYEITVKNNKKEAIQLQVKDLFPIPTDKEIEVELLEFSGADLDKEQSFLTWNMELKPGESRKLRMSYSVRYPKDKVLPL
ncbi:MAG: DUF4139 domain-containing protein [Pseudobacter sp.]|uniref:DUF4139 domain-containing protein n=1 Tax=Pseudobacter sp. TaxID=2045420 RepID=UPI003F7F7AE1